MTFNSSFQDTTPRTLRYITYPRRLSIPHFRILARLTLTATRRWAFNSSFQDTKQKRKQLKVEGTYLSIPHFRILGPPLAMTQSNSFLSIPHFRILGGALGVPRLYCITFNSSFQDTGWSQWSECNIRVNSFNSSFQDTRLAINSYIVVGHFQFLILGYPQLYLRSVHQPLLSIPHFRIHSRY